MLQQPAFLFSSSPSPDCRVHFPPPAPFSDIEHADLAPATDANRGAASTSLTRFMRSVAAPRLNTPPFIIGVEHDDPAVVGRRICKPGNDGAMNHFLSIFR